MSKGHLNEGEDDCVLFISLLQTNKLQLIQIKEFILIPIVVP